MKQHTSAKWHAIQPVIVTFQSLWIFNMSVSVGSDKVDDPKFLQGKEQICNLCKSFFFLIVHRKILQFLPKITMFSNGTSLLKWGN